MKIINSLSKREMLLIYVFTLLLVIFFYFNAIRGNLVSEYNTLLSSNNLAKEKQNNLIAELKNEEEKQRNFTNYIEIQENKNFGKNFNIETIKSNKDYKVSYLNISNVNKLDDGELQQFYIDKNISLISNYDSIKELTKTIVENKNLYLEDYQLNRIGKDEFQVNLIIREYTTLAVPFNGVAYSEKNLLSENIEENTNSKDLLSSLYSAKEVNNSKEETAGSSEKKEKISKSKENEIDLETDKIESIIQPASESNMVNELENFIIINSNNQIYNKGLEEYAKNITYLFDSEFVNNNIEEVNKISNIKEIIDKSSKDLLELKIEEDLYLTDYNLKIEKERKYVSFELDGDKNLMSTIYFLDNKGSTIIYRVAKSIDGFEEIVINLPTNADYPLRLCYIKNENSVLASKIRNVICYDRD